MDLLTRGEMRDAVRRHLSIVPPIDDPEAFPDAKPGDAPDYAPRPTNPDIDMRIGNKVSDLNLASGSNFRTAIVSVPVAAQTANGPIRISLEGQNFDGATEFQINQVRDAWWQANDTGAVRIMTAWSLDTLSRELYRYQSYPPGIPYRYAIEGYAIWLVPAPAADGLLFMRTGMGIFPPLNDLDTLHDLPADCASAFVDIVAADCAMSMVDDATMQVLAQTLVPQAQQSEKRILMTLARMSGKLDDHMTIASYRRRMRR